MTTELEARLAELREIVNQPSEKERAATELAEVERRLAEQRETAAKTDAAARIVAIKRAHGSLLQEYERDQERVRRCTAELGKAIQTINGRFEQLTELELEARDIGKDFGLPVPDFADLKGPHPTPPADLLRAATPTGRPLDVNDATRMRREHDAKREGPAATRYDFR